MLVLNPFLRVFRPKNEFLNHPDPTTLNKDSWLIVLQSEYQRDLTDPIFEAADLGMSVLNHNNMQAFNKWQVLHHDEDDHSVRSVGFCYAKMVDIMLGPQKLVLYDEDRQEAGFLYIQATTENPPARLMAPKFE